MEGLFANFIMIAVQYIQRRSDHRFGIRTLRRSNYRCRRDLPLAALRFRGVSDAVLAEVRAAEVFVAVVGDAQGSRRHGCEQVDSSCKASLESSSSSTRTMRPRYGCCMEMTDLSGQRRRRRSTSQGQSIRSLPQSRSPDAS